MWSLLFLACAHEPTAHEPTPTPSPTKAAPLVLGEADANGNETVLMTAPGPASLDPASLYAGCRARVEGEEKAGECTVDADCARAGCSLEVCVPATTAPSVHTMCDVQPCFAVLDVCGCVSGQCTWSLKASP